MWVRIPPRAPEGYIMKNNNDFKWFMISFGFIFTALIISMGISLSNKDLYNKEIVVACYESGKLNCEKLYK